MPGGCAVRADVERPDVATARAWLRYEAATGKLYWLQSPRFNVPAGVEARGHGSTKYGRIGFGGRYYHAHNLVWLIVRGEWPAGVIDHINGDKTDNRVENLRDVTPAMNSQNRRQPTRANTTGFLGVTWSGSKIKPYCAQITINGRTQAIGNFATGEEAHKAYVARKRQVHPGCTL
jgi:hypothetical protein